MSVEAAAVLGTGMMGPGIAITMALAGHPVHLWGRTTESVRRGLDAVAGGLGLLAGEGVVESSAAEAARGRIGGSTELAEAIRGAAFVFESVAEDLAVKQELFARLDELCSPSTIIASNTSGLPISAIAARMGHPERAVTAHFWNPPHLVPLVEIVRGDRTSDETVARTRQVLERVGKRPVTVLKDVPGQLGNRLLHAIFREAFFIVQEGIATAEDVDTAMKNGPGLRFPAYGPLEHADVVGLDLVSAIETYLLAELCNATEPLPLVRGLMEQGHLGVKTGRGLYDWSVRDPAAVKSARDRWLVQQMKQRIKASNKSSQMEGAAV